MNNDPNFDPELKKQFLMEFSKIKGLNTIVLKFADSNFVSKNPEFFDGVKAECIGDLLKVFDREETGKCYVSEKTLKGMIGNIIKRNANIDFDFELTKQMNQEIILKLKQIVTDPKTKEFYKEPAVVMNTVFEKNDFINDALMPLTMGKPHYLIEEAPPEYKELRRLEFNKLKKIFNTEKTKVEKEGEEFSPEKQKNFLKKKILTNDRLITLRDLLRDVKHDNNKIYIELENSDIITGGILMDICKVPVLIDGKYLYEKEQINTWKNAKGKYENPNTKTPLSEKLIEHLQPCPIFEKLTMIYKVYKNIDEKLKKAFTPNNFIKPSKSNFFQPNNTTSQDIQFLTKMAINLIQELKNLMEGGVQKDECIKILTNEKYLSPLIKILKKHDKLDDAEKITDKNLLEFLRLLKQLTLLSTELITHPRNIENFIAKINSVGILPTMQKDRKLQQKKYH